MSYIEKPFLQTTLDNNTNRIKLITSKKKLPINFRYTRNQFCSFQKYVDHRPNPFRPLKNSISNTNLFNYPIQKEKYISCYKYIDKSKLHPLITRNDLIKYLKSDSILLRHKTPCNSCSKINEGNYGRNYYSIIKKSFPFIKGNFTGKLNKFYTRYKTPTNSRNQANKLKYKFLENINKEFNNTYNTEEKNISNNQMFKRINSDNTININKNNNKNDVNIKEERKNEKEEEFDINKFIKKNENKESKIISRNASSNYFYRPIIRKRFHKTQIFDHCKPFLVDEFKEYGGYK